MTTTPLVALQRPKDISLDELEAELSAIWHSQSGGDKSAPIATRASTFSMVVYEPEEFQQLLAVLSFYKGPIDGSYGEATKAAIELAQKAFGLPITRWIDPPTLARLRQEVAQLPPERFNIPNINLRGASVSEAIAAQNPCRIITLCSTLGEDTGVQAEVSAYCPVQKSSNSNLICCEYITLRGTKTALNRVGGLVKSLLIPDLPKFLWWKATPNPEQELFKQLIESCHCLILDSSYFAAPESEFLKIKTLTDAGTSVADLNWHRLQPWQELTAAAFDPPERRSALVEVDRVTIDYEKGNVSQAFMFLSWIASRLGWQPQSYTELGGDYDLKHIVFTGTNEREIIAELAAIPTADPGEIVGDLIGLSLSSTNPNADCSTIICSETTGCMRMEAGGKAQAARTAQVTASNDQKAEFLLSQQLQRWGRDALYEESLEVAVQIIAVKQV